MSAESQSVVYVIIINTAVAAAKFKATLILLAAAACGFAAVKLCMSPQVKKDLYVDV